MDKVIRLSTAPAAPPSSGGFVPPAHSPLGQERRIAALAELIASAALTAATIAVVAVLSLGIARADAAERLAAILLP